MPASEETFEQLVNRIMADSDGKNLLLTNVIKRIMTEIAKKLDEDRNASLRSDAQMEDGEAAFWRPKRACRNQP
jgi:ribosomal protein S7